MKLIEYRGFEVEVSESSGSFTAKSDDYSISWTETLDKLKEKIDRVVKSESKKGFPIEVFQVIQTSFETCVIKGKLTSYNREDKSVWFSGEKGRREKINLSYASSIYIVNEANANLLSQFEEKVALIKQTNREIGNIKGQLTQWKPEATDETK